MEYTSPAMPGPGQLLDMYSKMALIRQFEEAVIALYKQNLIRGSTHVYIGEEAIAVGACAALQASDYITSTHRGHGHCIAKGGDVKRMMAELLGKATGYCKGKGGSMHIADLDLGILGANGIVGGGIPLATGAGLTISMRRSNQVVACFFGDAAINQGAFHESINMAAVWKLPVIYICENNLYGVSTRISESAAIEELSLRAAGYGVVGVTIDGNDVLQVYNAVMNAANRARSGGGPTLIEAKTYRWEGHFVGDGCPYRSREELEEWKARDPIERFGRYLMERQMATSEQLSEIKREAERAIEEAIEYAKASPDPGPEELFQDVYA